MTSNNVRQKICWCAMSNKYSNKITRCNMCAKKVSQCCNNDKNVKKELLALTRVVSCSTKAEMETLAY